jgi:hypothetical protein
MSYLAIFFAGAFLCNCVPHLAAGLRGEPFPSPFAKPPGRGDSSPEVNVLWGLFNLLAGAALLHFNSFTLGVNPGFALFAAGVLVTGLGTARHFGKVRRDKLR